MIKRILLVDDERSIRESLSKILGAENYEVALAENGQEAIERHGAQRARNRASGSQSMPSDHQPFDGMLLKCCITPSPLPESKGA